MSREVDPRRHVVWSLPELDRCLEEYLFRIYPSQKPPKSGVTLAERFAQGLKLTGQRLHRKVPYDQKFFLLSLPPSRRGVATVDRRRGIQVEGIRYHADALRALEGKRVNVRVDPEDAGHLYVHAPPAESWIECHSEHYRNFHGCSRRLVRLATAALRGQRLRGAKSPRTTAAALARFLNDVRQHESIERQRLRDAARRSSQPPAAASGPVRNAAVPGCRGEGSTRDATATAPHDVPVPWSELPAPTEAP